MSIEQGMHPQQYATSIEHVLCKIFECDRGGFGGMVNSDSAREHPYLSMTQGLAYLYALLPNKRKAIDNFVEHFWHYRNLSIDELLSFDTNQKTVGITTIQIEKENGTEQIKYMIEEFRKIAY